MARRRRTGPKPKPPAEIRRVLIGVRVTADEYGRLRAAAGDEPAATWIRKRAFEALDEAAALREARRRLEEAEALAARARSAHDRALSYEKLVDERERRLEERVARVEAAARTLLGEEDGLDPRTP